ncbi:MAG: TIGR04255 family protein [Mycobacterium sp.]|nr:TIGR04255 family protein [Mycobacterium sp.]
MLSSMSDDAAGAAPVALVTMEIRHPATDSLSESSTAALKELLLDELPIERQAQDAAWAASPGGGPTLATESFARFLNQDNTLAASMRSQAIVIETTAYSDFVTLVEVAMRVLDARHAVSPVAGVERVGLRYILELRASAGRHGRVEWTDWIAEPLLGPQRIAPDTLSLTELQGAAVYQETQPGRSMILRYGPGMGQALDPNFYLRRTLPVDAGPFFLLDIDSFWTPVRQIPEYDGDVVLSTFEALCEPAHTAFQQMLSSRLKDELVIR